MTRNDLQPGRGVRGLAFAAAIGLSSGAAMAADISWATGPSFGGALGHQGILTNGSLVEAVNLRGFLNVGPQTVDPGGLNITFTSVNSTPFAQTFEDPANDIGDAAWARIIRQFEYATTDVDAATFLTGLTPGSSYQVQLFAGRSHTCCAVRTQRFGDGNGHFSDPIQFVRNNFVSIVGTFTADAATQRIVFDDSVNAPILSAYVLRNVTAPVPEPGTWALMAAGLGVLPLLSRRRRPD